MTHEIIEGVYTFPWHVETKFIDVVTWSGAYANGYREPNYPMPTTIAETFIVKDTVAIYHTNRDAKVLERVWFKH